MAFTHSAYNATGVTQGSEFQVNASTTGDQLFPNVAMDSAGDFAVVWADSYGDGSGFDIVAQRVLSRRNGARRRNHRRKLPQRQPAGAQSRSLAVAMDSSGDFVVSWAGKASSGTGYTIYTQPYSASGVAQGSALQAGANTAAYQEPAVAMDAAGDFAVAWDSFDDSAGTLLVQRYTRRRRGPGKHVRPCPASEPAVSRQCFDRDGRGRRLRRGLDGF